MSYQLRIQKAIDYIEKNLSENIILEDVAGIAGFSLFHFHRIFHAMVGTSVKDYIRKRRMDNAAHELLDFKFKILDIAIKNHYESQESFSRAFKKVFGLTPGQYRTQSRPFTILEKENLLEKVKNPPQKFFVNHKIVERPELTVIGMEYNGSDVTDLLAHWGNFRCRRKEIRNLTNPDCCLGLYFHDSFKCNNERFTYIAGVEVESNAEVPDGMVTTTVPAGKYTIFTHQGSLCNIRSMVDKVYSEWLPDSGYEPAFPLEIYMLDKRFTGNKDTSEFDIAFPIK